MNMAQAANAPYASALLQLAREKYQFLEMERSK
jgi:F0F1-type ATP synthase delta subunit